MAKTPNAMPMETRDMTDAAVVVVARACLSLSLRDKDDRVVHLREQAAHTV